MLLKLFSWKRILYLKLPESKSKEEVEEVGRGYFYWIWFFYFCKKNDKYDSFLLACKFMIAICSV